MLNALEKARIEIEKIDVGFGIKFTELKNNLNHHSKLFYTKWGIPYKYENGQLYYSDDGYHPRCKRTWDEAYMEGFDLPYVTFFTPREFQRIKPWYLI